jgi:hypothetical protein
MNNLGSTNNNSLFFMSLTYLALENSASDKVTILKV